MTVDIATDQILRAIEKRKDGLKCKPSNPAEIKNNYPFLSHIDLTADRRCVGVARVGSSNQTIAVDTLESISGWDLGSPLHSLVIVGETHPIEDKMLNIVCNAVKKIK